MDIQIAYLERFAQEQGYTNISWYVDNGYSGLSFDRPGFSEMETAIQGGEVDVVLVKDISHIGRNQLDTMMWIHDLESKGVQFITANHVDGTHSHSLTAAMEQLARSLPRKRK